MNIFNTWKVIDQKNQVITTLWILLATMVLMNFYMYLGWRSMPMQQTVYFPPDLSKGGVFENGHIPLGQIYAFGFHIFSGINSWDKVGADDYNKAINANKPYLSHKFYSYLQDEVKRKQTLNELNRRRISYDANESFDPSFVSKIDSETWRINYRLHIQESIDSNIFKEWIEVYPIIIKRVNTSIEHNPWGLEIAGFFKEPYREKTIIQGARND